MKSIEVKKGDVVICQDSDMVIKARSLGSCLAICVHDSVSLISAVGVAVMPCDPEGLKDKAGYSFVEPISGLAGLFKEFLARGSKRKNLRVWLVGAGRHLSGPSELDTGAQLYSAVKKVLAKNKVPVQGESVGGPFNRSLEMISQTGEINVMTGAGKGVKL